MDIDAGDDGALDDVRDPVESPMRRLFGTYGRENRWPFIVGVIASVVARLLDLLPPVLLGIAIDATFRQDRPFALGPIPLYRIAPEPPQQVLLSAGIIAGAFLFAAGFHWARNWGWNMFAQRIQHAVRTDTYDRMQDLEMGFFVDRQTGELLSVLSNDVNRLERFLNDGLNSAFRLAVMVVAIAVILFVYNWQLALLTLVVVPLIAAFTYRFVQTIQPKYAAVRSTVGHLNSRIENNLAGIRVIKSATTEPEESARVEDSSGEYLDANWEAIETRIRFFPGLRVLSGVGFVVTFLVGGLWVYSGEGPWILTGTLSEGEFVVFILLSQRFIWPMAQFGQIINMYQRAYASAERIFGLMDYPTRIDEPDDAPPLDVTDGRVSYDGVTFGYDRSDATPLTGGSGTDASAEGDAADGDAAATAGDDSAVEPVLRDVSVSASGGATVGVVGPTGAGKSTLLSLLVRLYDVDRGAITIDGQDVRDVSVRSLRQAVGYVGQDPYLFDGTVRENISYGTPEATDEAIRDAARAAEAHAFVSNLDEGYDTQVGERGVKLSGGQRQRIVLARAILADPPILVLDEATSDVDTETEMLIQRSLNRLTADRTTFVIAHRLSTVRDADQIVVLEDGQIVERGTHDELVATDGLYASLWAVQAGEIDDLPDAFVERARDRRATVEEGDD
ncbi:ABC transporter ATP-binding protein [Halococcoides cellulosivorans]|uniref:Multidrug ABC transporter ATP-binding protein n=1 Tax=Halococcoides cellulosivorans TaxID=1679096 RepID=A0A2R4WZU5_9EURY|nr:ABC transporter ATP-binding protein [Halococcoides cellulosivorans]AWB27063.1 multidrug ABC transporter ATP-binding protein [Halococcoides cellulosivorans]